MKQVNKLKDGAVPTIFSTVKKPLKRLSSENRITTQAKKTGENLLNFLLQYLD